MVKQTPTDTIYRAAIAAAGSLDPQAPLSRDSAGIALQAALERTGISTRIPEAKNGGRDSGGVLEIAGTEGIVVGMAGEERSGELPGLLRQHHWQRAHLVSFGPLTLSIRTVAA